LGDSRQCHCGQTPGARQQASIRPTRHFLPVLLTWVWLVGNPPYRLCRRSTLTATRLPARGPRDPPGATDLVHSPSGWPPTAHHCATLTQLARHPSPLRRCRPFRRRSSPPWGRTTDTAVQGAGLIPVTIGRRTRAITGRLTRLTTCLPILETTGSLIRETTGQTILETTGRTILETTGRTILGTADRLIRATTGYPIPVSTTCPIKMVTTAGQATTARLILATIGQVIPWTTGRPLTIPRADALVPLRRRIHITATQCRRVGWAQTDTRFAVRQIPCPLEGRRNFLLREQ
jgi:hypothetical protein